MSHHLLNERVIAVLLSRVEALQVEKANLTAGDNSCQLDLLGKRYERYELSADMSQLSEADRAAVAKLVEASRVVNDIFAQQLLGEEGVRELDRVSLACAGNTKLLRYIKINKGMKLKLLPLLTCPHPNPNPNPNPQDRTASLTRGATSFLPPSRTASPPCSRSAPTFTPKT